MSQYLYFFTGGACRLRVVSRYQKQFSCPADAEKHYFGHQEGEDIATSAEHTGDSREVCTQTDGSGIPVVYTNIAQISTAYDTLRALPNEDLLKMIASLFQDFALTNYGVQIPSDFLYLSVCAIQHLNQCGRSNVLYGLTKAIETMRSDGSDSRLPAKRMPAGLIEHMVSFFNADSYHKVRIYSHCHLYHTLIILLSPMNTPYHNHVVNFHNPDWKMSR